MWGYTPNTFNKYHHTVLQTFSKSNFNPLRPLSDPLSSLYYHIQIFIIKNISHFLNSWKNLSELLEGFWRIREVNQTQSRFHHLDPCSTPCFQYVLMHPCRTSPWTFVPQRRKQHTFSTSDTVGWMTWYSRDVDLKRNKNNTINTQVHNINTFYNIVKTNARQNILWFTYYNRGYILSKS